MIAKSDWIGMAISGAAGGAVIGSFMGTTGSILVALVCGVFGGFTGYYTYHKNNKKGEHNANPFSHSHK